jgi:hypothetical protein
MANHPQKCKVSSEGGFNITVQRALCASWDAKEDICKDSELLNQNNLHVGVVFHTSLKTIV